MSEVVILCGDSFDLADGFEVICELPEHHEGAHHQEILTEANRRVDVTWGGPWGAER